LEWTIDIKSEYLILLIWNGLKTLNLNISYSLFGMDYIKSFLYTNDKMKYTVPKGDNQRKKPNICEASKSCWHG